MDDLVRWLGEQLDEDERIARSAAGRNWLDGDGWLMNEDMHIAEVGDRPTLVHIAAHDPARVLREIDAKRDLLRFAEGVHDYHETFTAGVAARLERTLRLYALAYKDRPGYRPEWRP